MYFVSDLSMNNHTICEILIPNAYLLFYVNQTNIKHHLDFRFLKTIFQEFCLTLQNVKYITHKQ